MAKGKTYDEINEFIKNRGCILITTENEFNERKKHSLPSQVKLTIKCKCGEEFIRTFNSMSSGNSKVMCRKCSRKDTRDKQFPIERINKIISLYKSGKTMKEIAKEVKTKPQYISNILKENNIKIRHAVEYLSSDELDRNRVNFFNQRFFEKIDNLYKAYWLGFLYADGNVFVRKGNLGYTKGGTVELSLKREDKYHLENFKRHIEGNMKIEDRIVKLNGKSFEASRISLSSIRMAKDLIKHGCVPKKSLILDFPTTVPDDLINHFIRGYIDGDGSVVFYTYDKVDDFYVTVLGTENFLIKLSDVLIKNEINSGKIRKTSSKAYELHICGRDNLAKLYNFLYKNANVFLERKREQFRKALIYFEKEFDISPAAKLMYSLDEDLNKKLFFRKHVRPLIKSGEYEKAEFLKRVLEL
ncbi:hypothetical protein [Bacillus smithii]|uniref:hypothetical protein n=1 Tax=Bacillus smithii TaxID=1479 RepID=UPI002E1A8822|nr:hypothetical protein [Bacillus smithii]MED4928959.1 hypothetical protein [Bacillus smithii]